MLALIAISQSVFASKVDDCAKKLTVKSSVTINLADGEFLEKVLGNQPPIDKLTIRRRIEAIIRQERAGDVAPSILGPFKKADLNFIRVRSYRGDTQIVEAVPNGAKCSPNFGDCDPNSFYIVAGPYVYRRPGLAAYQLNSVVYNFEGDVLIGRENLSEFALSKVTDTTVHLTRIMGLREFKLWEVRNLQQIKTIGEERASRPVLHFNVGHDQLWHSAFDLARFDVDVPISTLRNWVSKKWAVLGWHNGNRVTGRPGVEIAVTMDALKDLVPLMKVVGDRPIVRFGREDLARIKSGPYQGKIATIVSVLKIIPTVKYQVVIYDDDVGYEEDESNLT